MALLLSYAQPVERVGIYVTPEYVAKLMKVTSSSVYRWIKNGNLKAYRFGSGRGSTIRITLEDVAFSMDPVNQLRNREDFLERARKLYEDYLKQNPKLEKLISTERLNRVLDDYATCYALKDFKVPTLIP